MTEAADDTNTPPPSPAIPTPGNATTAAKKSRGRPPKSSAPETPQQRIDRLKAQLREAEEAQKIAEQQRDAIVGRVVVAHALAHADFKRQLSGILRAAIKSKADLAAIGELLH